jgi:hypothetical protein
MTQKKAPHPPDRAKTGGPKTAPAAPAREFEVQLQCPHCGGPFIATDATVSHTCEHCRSLLIIGAPEREEVFVEPAQITEPAAILETLLRYRVDAHRAALVAKHSDPEGNPPPDLLVNSLLKRFEARLRASARIIDSRLIHAPYRQTSGKIVQAVLGRHGDGPKIARLRAYLAEQTSAAYDPARFNLRDAGLRLGRSVFKPLMSADVAKLGRFLPRLPPDASRRELEKWRGQNLEAGFESVAKQGRVVVTFEATVYRPYFLVRAMLDRGDETLLFDAGFGTIAGYLSDEERNTFTVGKDADPLGTAGASFRHVFVTPSRCPNCGMDPKLAEAAIVSVCENCHAGIAPTAKGLTLVNYEREEGTTASRDTVLLPFWRFPFEISLAGAPVIRTLEAYAEALFPQGVPKGFSPQGPHMLVPAFRLLTTAAGDQAFTTFASALHARPWTWTPDRVGLEARPRFVPVSFPEDEARQIAWSALFALHTKTSAARLNTLLLKQKLFDAKLSFGPGTVALIAFTVKDKVFERPDVSIPRLLIEGGPVLAAQRMTVQAAAAAFIAAQKRPSMADRVKTSRFTGGQE